MEIKYLTKMKNTPKIGRFENKGISELEIAKLESEFKIKFPQAYKEFLFLGGKREFILEGWSTEAQYLDWIQANIKQSMDDVNLKLKPFFVFAEYNNNQCLFFFLNDGENPPIYGYDEGKIYTNDKGEEVYYKKTKNSFSDCIDNSINHALNNK
ncbi:TPA: SMI1/KNR4 family protein [Elizabethkingia anophelis]|nr:SMI1/KNR4 family protein [Elizabethkingia anophelis]